MKMSAPVYPGGWLGAGLVVLRLSMAAGALTFGGFPELGEPGQWLLAVVCASLGLGAGARWSAAVFLITLGPPMFLPRDLAVVGGMAALILTGPGAYSIDARVWGRIRVRPGSPR